MTVFLLLFLFFFNEVSSNRLSCYHCISQVPLELVLQDAKDAFKEFMFTKFNIPPSHVYCAESEAYEFSTVKIENCAAADHCIKTIVKEIGFDFVMRGCLSTLYKPGFQISTNATCNPPAANCLCDTDLCNTAMSSGALILSFILVLLIR